MGSSVFSLVDEQEQQSNRERLETLITWTTSDASEHQGNIARSQATH